MGAIYLKFRNIPGQAKHMNYVRLAVVSGEWQAFLREGGGQPVMLGWRGDRRLGVLRGG